MLTLVKAVAAVGAVVVGAALGLVTQAVDDALAGFERAASAVERPADVAVHPTAAVRTAAAHG